MKIKRILIIVIFFPLLVAAGPNEERETNSPATAADTSFLLGRWKSEEYIASGKTIRSKIYVFSEDSQGQEGKSTRMIVREYIVKGNVIIVKGAVDQTYTIIDKNTVSYKVPQVGLKTLKRL